MEYKDSGLGDWKNNGDKWTDGEEGEAYLVRNLFFFCINFTLRVSRAISNSKSKFQRVSQGGDTYFGVTHVKGSVECMIQNPLVPCLLLKVLVVPMLK